MSTTLMPETTATTGAGAEVVLDERAGEANGAAYLVHMLLSQRATVAPARFAAASSRLRPVVLHLRDTGEGCRIEARDGRLVVTSRTDGPAANTIVADSAAVVVITQLRLLSGWLVAGPFDRGLLAIGKDVLRRRARIGGLVLHYANVMRFLQLVNVR